MKTERNATSQPENFSEAEPFFSGIRRRILALFPPGQFLRYLCVGVFNTVFGYSVFAALNWYLDRRGVRASYMYAYTISNFINITVAYFGYKIFVFKTKGNYLREWLKAMAVYWSGFLPGLVIIPAAVFLMKRLLPPQFSVLHHSFSGKEAAPYIANAVLMGFGVIYSFLGHRNITFRAAKKTGTAA